MVKRLSALAGLALAAIAATGCCQPARLNVTVQLDDAMRQKLNDLGNRNIEVDIVAVNAKEHERWEGYSMSSYWQPGDTLKGSIPTKIFTFSPSGSSTTKPGSGLDAQTLSMKDPIWDKWYANLGDKAVERLYVLALLPGTTEDKPGDQDARRQILPLSSCRWKTNTIVLKVQPGGLITVTPPKPGKN